jgi:hypothetical protein
MAGSIKKFLLGKARNFRNPRAYQGVTLAAFLAWVGLGADCLASVSYGPPEAFAALTDHPYLGLIVAAGTAVTIFVLSRGYNKLMEDFPSGGGGYVVAGKLLSPKAGAVAGCALLIDYILDIAISCSSGVEAVLSFLPQPWHAFKLPLSLGCVALLAGLNLRGSREAVTPMIPIFTVFLLSHLLAVGWALGSHAPMAPAIAANASADFHRAAATLGLWGAAALVMHAFSLGAGTYTGIEAVSNGIPILREPKVQTARRTMFYMWTSLAFLAFGLMAAYAIYQVKAEPGRTLNASLYYRLTQNRGWSGPAVWTLLASEALMLFAAAQTGFLGGPRIASFMALDGWLPKSLAQLSSRLVNYRGILLVGSLAFAAVLLTGASVHSLVILFSINVFLNFVMSQGAMTLRWIRGPGRGRASGLAANGSAFLLSAFILCLVVAFKFREGGWVTLALTSASIAIVLWIKRMNDAGARMLRRARVPGEFMDSFGTQAPAPGGPDPEAMTAVILVKGFNGLGLSTLAAVNHLFRGLYRNFVFVEIGIVDARIFQDGDLIRDLRRECQSELRRYEKEAERLGFYGESMLGVGIDLADELEAMFPALMGRYPNFAVFGGKPIFGKPSPLRGLLSDHALRHIQDRLALQGIPVVQIPIMLKAEC